MPFSDEFKRHTSGVASGKTRYGLIPKDDWLDGFPSWVNETRARAAISEMGKQPIPYGGSIPYRHMCRYQSGKFFRHELLKGYEYYWRVEPDVKFYCDIVEDPFVTMKRLDKSYGFVVSLYEYQATIPTLWQTTKGAFSSVSALLLGLSLTSANCSRRRLHRGEPGVCREAELDGVDQQ